MQGIEDIQQIAGELQLMLSQGLEAKSGLTERWSALYSLYMGEPYSRSFVPYEGAATFNIPVIQPKIDGLCAHICTGITSNRPYFLGSLQTDEPVQLEQAESLLQFMLESARFPLKLRQLALMSALYGRAVVRVTFDAGNIAIEAIHPEDFVVFPASVESIEQAQCVGHRFWLREKEVRVKYSQEVLFESGNDSDLVELWALLVKLDLDQTGKEQTYEVVLRRDTHEVLLFRPYPLLRPWYFAPFFLTEPGGFWHQGSVANNLQGLQVAMNELWNLMYDGALMSAFPTQFVSDGTMPEASVRSRPGDVIPVIGQPHVHQVTVGFEPSVMPVLMQHIDQLAEAITRVPRSALGQEFRVGVTATEVAALQSSLAVGLNEYSQNFGDELGAMAQFCWDLIRRNFRSVFRSSGVSLMNPEILGLPIRWELNGKTPSNTPSMRYAMAERLLNLNSQTGGDKMDVDALVATMVEASELPNSQRILRAENADVLGGD